MVNVAQACLNEPYNQSGRQLFPKQTNGYFGIRDSSTGEGEIFYDFKEPDIRYRSFSSCDEEQPDFLNNDTFCKLINITDAAIYMIKEEEKDKSLKEEKCSELQSSSEGKTKTEAREMKDVHKEKADEEEKDSDMLPSISGEESTNVDGEVDTTQVKVSRKSQTKKTRKSVKRDQRKKSQSTSSQHTIDQEHPNWDKMYSSYKEVPSDKPPSSTLESITNSKVDDDTFPLEEEDVFYGRKSALMAHSPSVKDWIAKNEDEFGETRKLSKGDTLSNYRNHSVDRSSSMTQLEALEKEVEESIVIPAVIGLGEDAKTSTSYLGELNNATSARNSPPQNPESPEKNAYEEGRYLNSGVEVTDSVINEMPSDIYISDAFNRKVQSFPKEMAKNHANRMINQGYSQDEGNDEAKMTDRKIDYGENLVERGHISVSEDPTTSCHTSTEEDWLSESARVIPDDLGVGTLTDVESEEEKKKRRH